MYRVDVENKRLIEIPVALFSDLNLKERFDIQEWIEGTPQILGEPLLIIAKELFLPSGKRLDLLAVDKQGALVVIELKRDDSGADVEWQAIKTHLTALALHRTRSTSTSLSIWIPPTTTPR
jgi:RecB family endonuclease NucS